MPLSVEQAIGQKLMLTFAGLEPSAAILATLGRQHVGGVTLFRADNVESPAQVRTLTAALQQAAAAAGQPPLIIAADQEGGTLLALAGSTPFPGNLALGAAGDPELALRTGYALGRELAAMGINVNYAPVCDVNVNPDNPVVGPRSFGEDPARVAKLSAAMVVGLQQAGVAATPKHFPGHGDTTGDSHHGTPVLEHDEGRLREVEMLPFKAAIRAGARLMMTAHVALPMLGGARDLPATLSPAILRRMLRGELGFEGVIITDALNMQAIRQGPGLVIDAIAAVAAGVDMLLLQSNSEEQHSVYEGLLQATDRTLLSAEENLASAGRILELKNWVTGQPQPDLDVVANAEHLALAREVAGRAITLVRDGAGLLPLRLPAGARIAAVVPQPEDLTPADTSSYTRPALAEALRRHHPLVDEITMPLNPGAEEVASLDVRLQPYDLVIAATINAASYAGQAALINGILARRQRLIAVALRMPYDLLAYPTAPTYLCTYSILGPSLDALADAIWGKSGCPGRLPVSITGLYPIGHGMDIATAAA